MATGSCSRLRMSALFELAALSERPSWVECTMGKTMGIRVDVGRDGRGRDVLRMGK